MVQTHTRRGPVRLHFQDGQVIVTPQDQDRFFISAEKAVDACKSAIGHEERVERYRKGLLIPLAQWCEKHTDLVSACYILAPESAVIPVYVVGAGEQYDFALTEKLSELAFWFDDHGWSVHASQIPHCAPEYLSGFFDPGSAIQLYPPVAGDA